MKALWEETARATATDLTLMSQGSEFVGVGASISAQLTSVGAIYQQQTNRAVSLRL